MQLLFTRHGRSEANVQRVISNRDLPHSLTDKGREQAVNLAMKLAGENVTGIFSSPVLRAVETAQIIAEKLSLPYQINEALREYDCGILEGRGDAEAWSLHNQFMQDWRDGHNREQCPPGGETFYDIRKRFVAFIDGLLRDYGDGQANLLLVSHGGLYIFGLPHVLANVDFDAIRSLPLDHTVVIRSELRDGKLVCLEWGEHEIKQ